MLSCGGVCIIPLVFQVGQRTGNWDGSCIEVMGKGSAGVTILNNSLLYIV